MTRPTALSDHRPDPATEPANEPANEPATEPATAAGRVAAPSPAPRLTNREFTVLDLLAHGLTAAAIGRRLGISVRTVHRHQSHLYRKLHASDRLMAVLRAHALGLLDIAREAS
jgi:DNA-binding NarL/FixJ family response regulator